MKLPRLSSAPLPTGIERLLAQLGAQLDAAPEAYLRISGLSGDALLFFHQGKVHSAGRAVDDTIFPCSIRKFFESVAEADEAELCATDLPLFLCASVLFRKAPSTHIPADQTNTGAVLQSLAETGKDAVVCFRRGEARTLAFCRQGALARVYAAAGEPLPELGSPLERVAAYLDTKESGPISVDIYHELDLEPADAAGQPLESYAHSEARTPDHFHGKTLWLEVRLSGRAVYHHPIDREVVTIGRGPQNDLQLDNRSVSRRHARVVHRGDTTIIEDLGGENGVLIDGKPVKQAQLRHRQPVRIGKYELELTSEPLKKRPSGPPKSSPEVGLESTIGLEGLEPKHAVLLHAGKTVSLMGPTFHIGKDKAANLQIGGLLVAGIHLQLLRVGDRHRIRHVGGLRRLRLNGRVVRDALLKDGDRFEVAGASFLYLFHKGAEEEVAFELRSFVREDLAQSREAAQRGSGSLSR